MAYKVLGQTLTTAASANIVVNLIKDPSFEGITRGMTGATTTTSTIWSAVAGTQWYYQDQNGSYYSNNFFGDVSNTTLTSTAGVSLTTVQSRYGSKVVGWGSNVNTGDYNRSNYLSYGLSTSLSGATNSTSSFGGTTRSIPVTGSTLYYYGVDVLAYSYDTSYMRILWFNSSGTYISATSSNPLASADRTTWSRANFSVTSPSTAAYAGIVFNMCPYQDTAIQIAIDGVYFGTASSAASAFPDPSTGGTNSNLTAPFTGRYTSVHSGTANNSTTVQNFAGATSDLYTVPASSSAVVSTITVNNPTTSATTFRIAVVPSGETLALKHWIAFDIALAANATTALTLGLTLAAGDKIKVSNDTGNVSFAAFGSEN